MGPSAPVKGADPRCGPGPGSLIIIKRPLRQGSVPPISDDDINRRKSQSHVTIADTRHHSGARRSERCPHFRPGRSGWLAGTDRSRRGRAAAPTLWSRLVRAGHDRMGGEGLDNRRSFWPIIRGRERWPRICWSSDPGATGAGGRRNNSHSGDYSYLLGTGDNVRIFDVLRSARYPRQTASMSDMIVIRVSARNREAMNETATAE